MRERPRATRWPPPRPFQHHVVKPMAPACPRCGKDLPVDAMPVSAGFDIAVCFHCREPIVIDHDGVVEEERRKLEAERGVEMDAHQKYLKALKMAMSKETA